MMNTLHLPAWLSVPRQRRLAALTSGLLLLFAWLWRAPLEASMASHMLVQIPVLLIAGYLAAWAWLLAPAPGTAAHSGPWLRCWQQLRRYDEQGVPSLLALVFLLTYWMIPMSLDTALASPMVEAIKFVSLFAGGMLLADCLARANLVIQIFFLGNLSWMMAMVGMLYQDGSTRLCNFYLVDDQVLAGQGLVWLSALIPALWLGWQLGVRGGWQRLL
jgi:hypothetical protein